MGGVEGGYGCGGKGGGRILDDRTTVCVWGGSGALAWMLLNVSLLVYILCVYVVCIYLLDVMSSA